MEATTKNDAANELVVANSQTNNDNDEKLAIVRKPARRKGAEPAHLADSACFALAIGRNLSSIATTDLAIALLDHTSKNTVIRAEIRTAAAILGPAFDYWARDASGKPRF